MRRGVDVGYAARDVCWSKALMTFGNETPSCSSVSVWITQGECAHDKAESFHDAVNVH